MLEGKLRRARPAFQGASLSLSLSVCVALSVSLYVLALDSDHEIEIVGRRMREDWQQEQHQMPNDRALSLSLTHKREHEEAAAVLCFGVSLLLHHHLSCSCAPIHSYCLSRTSTLSPSQCCTLCAVAVAIMSDHLNQSRHDDIDARLVPSNKPTMTACSMVLEAWRSTIIEIS